MIVESLRVDVYSRQAMDNIMALGESEMRSVAKEIQAGALGVSCLIPESTTGPPERPAVSTMSVDFLIKLRLVRYRSTTCEHKTDSAPSSSDSQAGSLQ